MELCRKGRQALILRQGDFQFLAAKPVDKITLRAP